MARSWIGPCCASLLLSSAWALAAPGPAPAAPTPAASPSASNAAPGVAAASGRPAAPPQPSALPPAPQPPALPASAAAPIGAPAVSTPAATKPFLGPQCVIGHHPGVDDGSAVTATRVICGELRRAGIPARDPEDDRGAAEIYRLDVERLGRAGLVRLTRESPPGTVVATQQVVINRIDEILVIAPRIVAAVLYGRPMEDTAEVDNLAGNETRKYEKKHGEYRWDIGLASISAPGHGAYMGPGFITGIAYETPAFALGAWLHWSKAESGDNKTEMTALSIGGRYFFTRSSVSPFAGAGLAMSSLSLETSPVDKGPGSNVDNSGMGTYGEVGVEMFRLYSARLSLGLRFDLPFFTLKGHRYTYVTPPGATYASANSTEESKYVIPMLLHLTVGF